MMAIELAPTEVLPLGRIAVTLAYLATAWLCVLAYKTEKSGPDRPLRQTVPALWRVLRKHWPRPPRPAQRAAVWLGVAALLLAFAVAVGADVQGRVAEVFRGLAHAEGWYAQRGTLQVVLVLVVGVVGTAALLATRRLIAGQLRDFAAVVAGAVFLATYQVVRMVSLHAVDDVFRVRIAGIRMEWILELAAITVIAGGAAWHVRRALRARG